MKVGWKVCVSRRWHERLAGRFGAEMENRGVHRGILATRGKAGCLKAMLRPSVGAQGLLYCSLVYDCVGQRTRSVFVGRVESSRPAGNTAPNLSPSPGFAGEGLGVRVFGGWLPNALTPDPSPAKETAEKVVRFDVSPYSSSTFSTWNKDLRRLNRLFQLSPKPGEGRRKEPPERNRAPQHLTKPIPILTIHTYMSGRSLGLVDRFCQSTRGAHATPLANVKRKIK